MEIKKVDSFSFAILKRNYFFRCDLLLKFPFKGFGIVIFNTEKKKTVAREQRLQKDIFLVAKELFASKKPPTFNSVGKPEKEY